MSTSSSKGSGSMAGMVFGGDNTEVRAALYSRLRDAAFDAFDEGVTVDGVKCGVTIPDLIDVCQQIAREEHEDIHQSIAFNLNNPEHEDEDEDPICHLCGETILATRPIQPLHGVTKFNIFRGDDEPAETGSADFWNERHPPQPQQQ